VPQSLAVPPHLRLILDAANTVDVEGQRDAWATSAELARWLRSRARPAANREISASEHANAVAFRDAMRQVIADGSAPNFDAAAAPFAVHLAMSSGRPELQPADDGPVGGVAAIVAAIARASAEGTWERVKICPGDACLFAFYDESRNHSRTWCSMAVCGNRTKTKVYRARHPVT
jgi:predicted RNA-binding Zn ribbon-like protein